METSAPPQEVWVSAETDADYRDNRSPVCHTGITNDSMIIRDMCSYIETGPKYTRFTVIVMANNHNVLFEISVNQHSNFFKIFSVHLDMTLLNS